MVITLLIPLRRALHLEELITPWHFDMTARILILTSLIVTYSYLIEFALALHGGPSPERSTLVYRATGDYAPFYWLMVACNCVFPLLLFFKRIRTSPPALLAICIGINIGMWLERFIILVTSLSHERNPFDWWGLYRPTLIEAGITFGAFGWFFFWFLIFIKLLPAVSISELKEAAVHEVAHAG
jgi:Ni/Fe-hydrogenase subunit HybB-like protein